MSLSVLSDCVIEKSSSIFVPVCNEISSIGGFGLFCREAINAGDVVIRLGGHLYTIDDANGGAARRQSLTGYSEGIYLGHPAASSPRIEDFINHSCDPNLWLDGSLTIVARRNIKSGEELTVDYAVWEIEEDWHLGNACNCQSPLCRGEVTGRDWRDKKLQALYSGHFLPCLEERINELNRK